MPRWWAGRAHRDYLVELGMPPDRIALGYNAVDNDASTRDRAEAWRDRRRAARAARRARTSCAVSRFVPEKNLVRLIEAFARYRGRRPTPAAVGPGAVRRRPAGGPGRGGRRDAAGLRRRSTGRGSSRPTTSARWYAFAGGLRATRACRSRGAWWSTRPRRAGCRCSSRNGPAARRRWFPSRAGPPGGGSTRAMSRTWPARWPGWPGMPEDERLAMGRTRARRSSPTGGRSGSPRGRSRPSTMAAERPGPPRSRGTLDPAR